MFRAYQEIYIYVAGIPMPSQQYFLELQDAEIGELETKTSIVTALKLGSTELVLKDKSEIYF